MDLTCPDCKEEMVRYRYENPEGDWIFGWLCGCNEDTRKNRQNVSKPNSSDGLCLPVYYYRCPECKHEWQENKDLSECPECLKKTLRLIEEQKTKGIQCPPRRLILFDGQRELKRDSLYFRRQA